MADEKKEEKAAKVRRPQAQKRDLQNAKRREKNRQVKSRIKTTVRLYDEAKTAESLSNAHSLLDKAVKKGVIPANRGRRLKSRLAARQNG